MCDNRDRLIGTVGILTGLAMAVESDRVRFVLQTVVKDIADVIDNSYIADKQDLGDRVTVKTWADYTGWKKEEN